MYEIVEEWLDSILTQTIPKSVIALNFNLYENVGNSWSIELVGTESFDLENEDWCCDEVFDFGTRDNPFSWDEDTSWDLVLDKMIGIISKYLEQGLKANILKEYQGVGIGFVDGDIEILFSK